MYADQRRLGDYMRYVSRKVGGSKVVDPKGYRDEGDRMTALLIKRDKARAILDAAIRKRDLNKEKRKNAIID